MLQNQTFNQVEVDLFELMCKVLDQNLFAQVDWARNSYYFKELKVGSSHLLAVVYFQEHTQNNKNLDSLSERRNLFDISVNNK